MRTSESAREEPVAASSVSVAVSLFAILSASDLLLISLILTRSFNSLPSDNKVLNAIWAPKSKRGVIEAILGIIPANKNDLQMNKKNKQDKTKKNKTNLIKLNRTMKFKTRI